MLSLVTLSDQWSENPWKNQGINLVVSEIQEKPESLVNIFGSQGKIESHPVHFLLSLILKVTECANCLHPLHIINLLRFLNY